MLVSKSLKHLFLKSEIPFNAHSNSDAWIDDFAWLVISGTASLNVNFLSFWQLIRILFQVLSILVLYLKQILLKQKKNIMTLHEPRSYKNRRQTKTPHVDTNSTTPKYMKRVNELPNENRNWVGNEPFMWKRQGEGSETKMSFYNVYSENKHLWWLGIPSPWKTLNTRFENQIWLP